MRKWFVHVVFSYYLLLLSYYFKETAQLFDKYVYLFAFRGLDKKINTTFKWSAYLSIKASLADLWLIKPYCSMQFPVAAQPAPNIVKF